MRAGCEQHAQVNRQFLETNVESLQEFCGVQYEVDEPTGHTPKKRKRVSEEDNDANSNENDPERVVLAKTRSHQELLAEFRWVLFCFLMSNFKKLITYLLTTA